MTTKSYKGTSKKGLSTRRMPKFTGRAYSKHQVHVPAPDNLPDINPSSIYGLRWISQERAQEITGKSAYIVRRWATKKQAIDVTSLRLLQIWVWGIIPSDLFIKRGLRVCYGHPQYPNSKGEPEDILMTMAGIPITLGELEYFGWMREHYTKKLATLDAQVAAPVVAPKPTAQVIAFKPYLEAKASQPAADEGTA